MFACLCRTPTMWSRSSCLGCVVFSPAHRTQHLDSPIVDVHPLLFTSSVMCAPSMYLAFSQQSLVLLDLFLPNLAHEVSGYRLCLSQGSISFMCLVSSHRRKFYPLSLPAVSNHPRFIGMSIFSTRIGVNLRVFYSRYLLVGR